MATAPEDLTPPKRRHLSRRSGHGVHNAKEKRLIPEEIDKLRERVMNPLAKAKLQAHAAVLAVDMERGLYMKEGGKPWTGGYGRTEIAKAMGYNVYQSGRLPVIFEMPEFERAVEWERLRRDAMYRLEMVAMMPMVKATASAALVETTRRLFVEPEKIPDHVLFAETRKFIAIVAQYGADQPADVDVKSQINNFFINVKGLPEEGRDAAAGMMREEMRAITGLAAISSSEKNGKSQGTKIVEVNPEAE